MDNRRTIAEIIAPGVFESGIKFHTVWIDDLMAAELLLHNHKPEPGKAGTNRKPSQLRVNSYAELMENGEWLLSPQPLSFAAPNADGVEDQMDGQHRLLALRQVAQEYEGFRLPFTVASNVPAGTNMVTDTGNARTPRDFLTMKGVPHAAVVAPAVKMLYCYDQVPFSTIPAWRAQKMSPTLQQNFLDANTGLCDGMKHIRQMKSQVSPYVAMVMYHLIARQYDPFKAYTFLEAVEKGAIDGVVVAPAMWKMREFLSQQKIAGYKWDGFEQLGLLIVAANDWLIGADSFRPSRQLPVIKKAKQFPRLLTQEMLPEMPSIL